MKTFLAIITIIVIGGASLIGSGRSNRVPETGQIEQDDKSLNNFENPPVSQIDNVLQETNKAHNSTRKSVYSPDNNPITYDEDPKNYPLSKPKTYINTFNSEVQSPTHYNKVPPGATAICRDGTYSF